MTLKISDLSVGDWVGIDQAELNMPSDDLATAYIEKLRKPIRIKGISEDSDMVIADIEIVDEWGSIMMKCEHLRPIPITAEMLEKNGFAPDEYSNKIWSFIAERELIQYFFVNHNLCIRNHQNAVDVDVLHIHQLQHALRLAEVEKEIVMPNK